MIADLVSGMGEGDNTRKGALEEEFERGDGSEWDPGRSICVFATLPSVFMTRCDNLVAATSETRKHFWNIIIPTPRDERDVYKDVRMHSRMAMWTRASALPLFSNLFILFLVSSMSGKLLDMK